MQAACSALVTPLHFCQAAPLNSCSLVFHQQWPLHCLCQLTPHLLSCEVPPGWRILQVAGKWTTSSQLVLSSQLRLSVWAPSLSTHPTSNCLPRSSLCVWENTLQICGQYLKREESGFLTLTLKSFSSVYLDLITVSFEILRRSYSLFYPQVFSSSLFPPGFFSF